MSALPSIATARLPANYEAASRAIAECSRIDECQEWADKAEAMASYAKQAKDESLRKMADRIQARAIRRCGELLKQEQVRLGRLEHSGRPTNGAGAHTIREFAKAADLSKHKQVQAMRVASIPIEEFNEAVEAEKPPTVTQLARRGTQSKPLVDLGGIPAADYARATEAGGTLKRFAEFCKGHDPIRIAGAFKSHEVKSLREHVSIVDAWLDQFITNLKG